MASRHMGLCMALFAFLFSVLGYTASAFASNNKQTGDEPRASSPDERNAVIGFDGVLLGGFIASQWVPADVLQESKAYHFDRIWGGEEYKVYSVSGFEGVGVGSAIHTTRLFAVTRDAQTLGFGTAKLAIGCDWNPVPRQAVALDTKNATYVKILKDYLERSGLPDASPQIMQLFKVDLDGDGADEVVIVAQNIISRDTAAVTWEADKPLSRTADIPKDAKKGEYSLVLLRKIVNGKVREIPLSQYISLKDSETLPLLHKVYQFADLNGDGVMEIIVGENSCENLEYRAYAVKGDKAVKALANGMGGNLSAATEVAPHPEALAMPAEEARKILQTWLDSHPIQPHAILAREYKEYVYGGEAYYLFSLDDTQRYWLNFLVHKKTGELLYMMISDGEHVSIEIEPLDAWYAKHY